MLGSTSAVPIKAVFTIFPTAVSAAVAVILYVTLSPIAISIIVSKSALSEYVPKVVPFEVPDDPSAFEAVIVQLLNACPVVPSARAVCISDNLSLATTA